MVRVLLVDDDAEALSSLSRLIQRMPDVELIGGAAGVSEARELLRGTAPDVVLVDLHRRQDGEEQLCRDVTLLTDAPVVVLASFMTPERWDRVRAAGATRYLLKRIGTEHLGRELQRFA
jgi:two-component system response regulator CitB